MTPGEISIRELLDRADEGEEIDAEYYLLIFWRDLVDFTHKLKPGLVQRITGQPPASLISMIDKISSERGRMN